MYIISQATIFLGTSLHGCITSMSYGVPCISLDNRVVKAREFLKEYSINQQLYSVNYDQIFDSVKETLNIPMSISESLFTKFNLVSLKICASFNLLSTKPRVNFVP